MNNTEGNNDCERCKQNNPNTSVISFVAFFGIVLVSISALLGDLFHIVLAGFMSLIILIYASVETITRMKI